MKKQQKTTKFNPKTHVKLSDLADELKMDYRSVFAKQSRLGIKAKKYQDKDRMVLAFTKGDANKIRSKTAKFMTSKRLEVSKVQEKLKVSRQVLSKVLKALKITTVKYRRVTDKRSVPTVPASSFNKIKKALEKNV